MVSNSLNVRSRKGFPNIGDPAFRALYSICIVELKDLTKFSKLELLALHGFGPKALKLVQLALKEKGLSLKS